MKTRGDRDSEFGECGQNAGPRDGECRGSVAGYTKVAWRCGEAAFTLIEIMIAIAIFSLVLLAIYSSWTAILRGSKVGLNAAAEAQRTRMALRAIEEALGSAQLYAANLPYYTFIADTSEDFAYLDFVAHLPDSFPGSGLFHNQAVRRVSFSVEQGPNSQNQLLLRQSPLLEPPDSRVLPYTIVLAPNVSRFELEFLDTNSVEWLPEWTSTNKLPKVVKVTLGFGQKRGSGARPEDLAIRTVFLTSAAIPRDLQLPIGLPPVAPVQGGGARRGGVQLGRPHDSGIVLLDGMLPNHRLGRAFVDQRLFDWYESSRVLRPAFVETVQ